MSFLDLTNEDIPQLAASVPDIAGSAREIITNSYHPQVNVIFPDAKIDVLTAEVFNLRNTVEDIQQMQAERLLDGKDVLENTRILAKNSPKILSDAGDIKRSLQR